MTIQNTTWQVRFTLPDDALPLFSETLEEDFETFSTRRDYSGDPWIVEAISQNEIDADALKNKLTILAETLGIDTPDFTIEEVPDIDWLEHVYQSFKPIDAGRFFVHGSHYQDDIPANRIPIIIDAATAFGTGEHGTTKGCLLAIDSLAERPAGVIKKCLDMGCGSGILAFALARAFHVPVWAVDNDPESERVTKENACINGIAEDFHVLCGDGFNAPAVNENAPYDVIVANILAAPLVDMAPALVSVLGKNATVILSGLLQEQEDMVRQAYEAQGMTKTASYPIDIWQTLVMQRI